MKHSPVSRRQEWITLNANTHRTSFQLVIVGVFKLTLQIGQNVPIPWLNVTTFVTNCCRAVVVANSNVTQVPVNAHRYLILHVNVAMKSLAPLVSFFNWVLKSNVITNAQFY